MMSESSAKFLPGTERTLRALLTWVTTLLVLGVGGLLIYHFYALTSLLMTVLIIVYILLGPVNLMEWGLRRLSHILRRIPGYGRLMKGMEANPRILAVLLVYAVFLFLLVWSSVKFIPLLGRQVGEMSHRINAQLIEVSDKAIDWSDEHIGHGVLRNLFSNDIRQAESRGEVHAPSPEEDKPVSHEEKVVIHQSLLKNTTTQLENVITSALPNLINFLGGTLGGLLYTLVGALLTFYFLVDGYKIRRDWIQLLPKEARATVDTLLSSFHQVMFAFIKGQVMLGLLTGGYMFVIYTVFGVPYAFLLSCIFALAELLPVIGTWIGIIIGLTVILLNMPPITALWVWLCSYSYQTVKDNILAPKVVGDVMGLHPLVIILSLLICAKVAGLLGVLVALPLASIVNVIIRMMLQHEQTKKDRPERNYA